MITKKYYKVIRVNYEDSNYFRIKNISNEMGLFSIVKTGNGNIGSKNLEYSFNTTSWETYNMSTFPEIEVPAGTNIYLRGTNDYFTALSPTGDIDNTHLSIHFTKSYNVGGNIYYLINKNNPQSIQNNLEARFPYMFYNETNLINSNELNMYLFPEIKASTFDGTFYGCTNMITSPDFSNFTKIVGKNVGFPESHGGCTKMFYNCSSLTLPVDLSNVTILGGSSLTQMYQGCTSLKYGVDLRNVTTVNDAQYLMSTIYFNCSNIETVYMPNLSSFDVNWFGDWLYHAGTAVTGTKSVYCPTGVTVPEGVIPTGWTRVDY